MSYENSKCKKYIKDYLIKERIGVGSYGLVFKVIKRNEKNIYVLKQIPYISKDNKKQIEEIQNEARLLSLIDSKFVVKYYDSFEENNNIDIIMEYCEGGDLASYLSNCQKLSKSLSEDRIWKFFIQMSLGLEFLHNKKILHRDLKSMNIFLTKALDVKIGDLGVAKLLQNTSHAYTFIGTPFYLSPEVCEEKPYNDKSDVWALGCITYEMLMFKHPYEASNHAALFLKIINGKYEPVSSKYSEEIRKIVDFLLEKNHLKRPSMSQIIKMPIFISKAKQFGLLEYVVDSLENHNRGKRIKNIDSRKTPVKLINRMGISGSNLITNSNNNHNNNNSSSNIYVNNSKERSTTGVFNKKKHYQSQQKVKTNIIDYNYLKYKEQAQIKKMIINSNSNNKKTQLSQGNDNNCNNNNNIPHKRPSPNRMNLISASNMNQKTKNKQCMPMDIDNSKMILVHNKIKDSIDNSNKHNEEETSYKNKYMMSKRLNVSETKQSSNSTSVNSSRKESYHGIVQTNNNISNIKVKRDMNLRKNNLNDFNNNYYHQNNSKGSNDMKFNPGNDLNNFIQELNMKSSVLTNKDNNSEILNTQLSKINNSNKKIKGQNNIAKSNNNEVNQVPLWNDNEQSEANCEFEVIEAKDQMNQKAQHMQNGFNDNSYDDGEYNYHHNPVISDDENGNDNEEETVSIFKSTNFDEIKQEVEIEKENNELLRFRSEYKQLKEYYFNEIALHSSIIDIGKLFELYKLLEKDYDQIDDITLRINEYINKSFPSKEKANEVSIYNI